jgi:hypothetical protein
VELQLLIAPKIYHRAIRTNIASPWSGKKRIIAMGEEDLSLEQRAALARRQYWQDQYEAALAADDKEGAANALRFVQEYDAFLAILSCKPRQAQ